MRFKFTISLLVLMVTAGTLKAQVDPHFSQYYVYSYRVSGIYRNQWNSFKTPGASVELTTDKNINFGASILNQSAGDGGYNYMTAYASVAYTGVRFGVEGDQRFVFGMQAGFINRKFNPSKFTLGDQWNSVTGYNPNSISSDLPTKNSSMVFDMGAGVLYYDSDPYKKANFYGGLSVSHLTQPRDAFSEGSAGKIPMRYTLHSGVRVSLSDVLSVTPNILYLRQGTANEIVAGAYARIKATDVTDFLFGGNYRFKDAVSPYVGFNHNNMVLGVSYDVNNSDLGRMTKGSGSFEISMSFIGSNGNKANREQFICPRL
jgi:type IX secretion system PorP/SprF family membrane protein